MLASTVLSLTIIGCENKKAVIIEKTKKATSDKQVTKENLVTLRKRPLLTINDHGKEINIEGTWNVQDQVTFTWVGKRPTKELLNVVGLFCVTSEECSDGARNSQQFTGAASKARNEIYLIVDELNDTKDGLLSYTTNSEDVSLVDYKLVLSRKITFFQ